MTEAEALEVLAIVAAFFPGQVPDATAKAWAKRLASRELQQLTREDGMVGAQRMADTNRRPFFNELRDLAIDASAARLERIRRRDEQKAERQRPKLPARTTTNPIYPRAAARVAEWVAAEKRAGRQRTQAEVDAEIERILREETERT